MPVDSEHSALAQCLRAGTLARLPGWCSPPPGDRSAGAAVGAGGVTAEQALAHPTWRMGPVVTVNSATLVNKGLELIEAHLLFGVPYDQIDVVVHPQSVIHSMVTFTDGSTIAQASPPDMRLPIALALGWPDRVPDAGPACDFGQPGDLDLRAGGPRDVPGCGLARAAGQPVAASRPSFNAANEEAVAAFLACRISFRRIIDAVAAVLGEAQGWRADPTTVDDVLAAEDWAPEQGHGAAGRPTRPDREE